MSPRVTNLIVENTTKLKGLCMTCTILHILLLTTHVLAKKWRRSFQKESQAKCPSSALDNDWPVSSNLNYVNNCTHKILHSTLKTPRSWLVFFANTLNKLIYSKWYYDQKINFFSSYFKTMLNKHPPSKILSLNFEKKAVYLNCDFPI